MGAYTVDLAGIGPDDLAVAGGKAASLGALIQAGFPVPAGFVVTTAAYTEFVDAAGLTGLDPAQLREHIPGTPMSDELAASILNAYRELDAPAVAVRSSGTAEDLADASFAGQHDTYLNVTGEPALLAAVRDCWASLWTPRAVAYRRRHGWDDRGLALAVVIQAIVDSEWAGVLFTADPVTGRRDRLVVEAVDGLGEALVSGATTGHHHLIDKVTGDPVTGDSPLPAGVLDELISLGRQVEDAFGRPQDIEWTYAAGRCALLQARPMTAVPDQSAEPPQTAARTRAGRPHGRRRGQQRRGNHFMFAADHVPYPPYPMDLSLSVRPALRAVLDALRSTGFKTPRLDEVVVEIDDGVGQLVPPRIRPTPRALVGVPAALPKVAGLLRTRPAAWRGRCRTSLTPLTDRIDNEDLTTLSDHELLDRVHTLRRAQGQLLPSRFGCVLPRALLSARALAAVLRLATDRQRAGRLHTDLMSAIPCVTRDANQGLDRLAATIHATPELREAYDETDPADAPDRLRQFAAGRALLDDIRSYLERYGHRQISVPLAGFPPLRETPAIVHGLLGGLARAKGGDDHSGGTDDEARATRARAELTSARAARTRLLGPLALKLLDSARAGVGVREDSHFFLFMVVGAVIRRVLLEMGGRLVERDLLTDATDIFYLDLDELSDPRPEHAHDVVARRKAARRAALDSYTIFPAELLRGASTADPVLRGVPASRGTATGRVRVIRDENEFTKLADGEILVCPYTNPAWTPLFTLARAVVADTGGVASHASIVAREYGIPAVMGTGDGTRRLSDGQRVRVDGENGTVIPLDAEGDGGNAGTVAATPPSPVT